MRISYCSDLHCEFMDFPDFSNDKGGDVLILAGDITTASLLRANRTDGEARAHARYFREKFKHGLIDKYPYVFYVIGNHEHYNSLFHATKTTLTEGFAALGLDKIKILDNDMSIIDGVAFIGATLWSDFLKGSPTSMLDCQLGMNDFRIIGNSLITGKYGEAKVNPVTPEHIYGEFKMSLDFITSMLKILGEKQVIICSHHGPTMQSLNSKHSGNSLDGAYCSDLSELILDNPNIGHWIHGHTHQNFDYIVGNCRVLANQRGYNSERSYIEFEGTKSFEV